MHKIKIAAKKQEGGLRLVKGQPQIGRSEFHYGCSQNPTVIISVFGIGAGAQVHKGI